MMLILQTVATVFIFAPFLAFFLIYIAARKPLKRRAFLVAADLTTLVLFVAVPVLIYAIWSYEASALVCFVAIIIAIVFLVIEWKNEKELKVRVYIRKTWRLYFVVLAFAYLMIWTVGLIFTVSRFMLDSYGA
ncbi:DUF3397 family protein [Planococcus sp. N028]|uniref:DUF3397 family protein n=1 Tax=Planococcus shixiaomingii TaxID=3058393 RepID=A0ABT8N0D2_9BACL|nr:DUF3397 family protein [Planococcus sp. N028]MDN7241346.1 DUF3397 family protein [Planococcus sp. N028]